MDRIKWPSSHTKRINNQKTLTRNSFLRSVMHVQFARYCQQNPLQITQKYNWTDTSRRFSTEPVERPETTGSTAILLYFDGNYANPVLLACSYCSKNVCINMAMCWTVQHASTTLYSSFYIQTSHANAQFHASNSQFQSRLVWCFHSIIVVTWTILLFIDLNHEPVCQNRGNTYLRCLSWLRCSSYLQTT